MRFFPGSRDRLSMTEIREVQMGRDNAASTVPASSARFNCGDIVPSYSREDGKLFRIMERETGLEPATSSLGSYTTL